MTHESLVFDFWTPNAIAWGPVSLAVVQYENGFQFVCVGIYAIDVGARSIYAYVVWIRFRNEPYENEVVFGLREVLYLTSGSLYWVCIFPA